MTGPCAYTSHGNPIPQQILQMAFCDLSHTFHKQVTYVSQHVFVILPSRILTSPLERPRIFSFDIWCKSNITYRRETYYRPWIHNIMLEHFLYTAAKPLGTSDNLHNQVKGGEYRSRGTAGGKCLYRADMNSDLWGSFYLKHYQRAACPMFNVLYVQKHTCFIGVKALSGL